MCYVEQHNLTQVLFTIFVFLTFTVSIYEAQILYGTLHRTTTPLYWDESLHKCLVN